MAQYNTRGNRINYKDLDTKGVTAKRIIMPKGKEPASSADESNVSETSHINKEKEVDDRQKQLEAKQRQLEQIELESKEIELEEKLLAAQEELAAKKRALAARRAALDNPHTPLSDRTPTTATTNTAPPNQAHVDSAPATVTTHTLARDRALADCMEVLDRSTRNTGNFLSDVLGANPQEITGTPISTGKRTPLYIPDYVLNPSASTRATEHNLGRGLILRDSRSKVKTEEVTIEQWTGANARILIDLIGDGMEQEEVIEYLRYTAQIADLMQVSKHPSVMLLDEAHRTKMHQMGGRWDQIDPMKSYVFLTKKEEAQKPPSKRPWGTNRDFRAPTDSNGRPVCLLYNKEEGCPRINCRFTHVCSVPGCLQSHPKFRHQEVPPRFRPQSQYKPPHQQYQCLGT
jgi:hypothetical protein